MPKKLLTLGLTEKDPYNYIDETSKQEYSHNYNNEPSYDSQLNTEEDVLRHEQLKDIIVHQYSQAKKKKSFARCPIVYDTNNRPETTSKRYIY